MWIKDLHIFNVTWSLTPYVYPYALSIHMHCLKFCIPHLYKIPHLSFCIPHLSFCIPRSSSICLTSGIPCVTDCVIGELEKMGHRFRLALKLARDPRFKRLTCSHKGTYADDCIVQRISEVRSIVQSFDGIWIWWYVECISFCCSISAISLLQMIEIWREE